MQLDPLPGVWHPLRDKDRVNSFGLGVYDVTPDWLQQIGLKNSFTQDSKFWCSVLTARDIPAAEPERFGFELYNPQLVARQFGLCQSLAIPILTIGNHNWEARFLFEEEDVWQSPTVQFKTSTLPSFSACKLVTESYNLWWYNEGLWSNTTNKVINNFTFSVTSFEDMSL